MSFIFNSLNKKIFAISRLYKTMCFRILIPSCFFLSIFTANADVNIINNHFRTTYEEVKISNTEKMGFVGTSLLFDKKINTAVTLYSGLGIYSAATGNRGGFFTGGLESGLKYTVNNWIFDTGAFIGAGGGASAPQGGGLMLRPHVGLMYDFKRLKVGANYSQVKFPNGNIASNQVGLQFELPFQMATVNKLDSALNDHNFDLADVYFTLTAQTYSPKSNVKTRSGTHAKKMQLGRFEAGRYFNKNSFYFGEAGAAFGGSADGYAEFLGGLGYDYLLSNRFNILGKVAIGTSGGGNVDTQGGLIYKVTLGAKYRILPRLYVGLDYGLIDATKGSFHADILQASLNYNFSMLVPSSNHTLGSPLDLKQLDLTDWSIAASASRYLASNTLRKSGTDDTPVDLINLKLNRHLTPRTYLTGQAAAAYKGKSGGYATGLIGFGVKQPLTQRLAFQAEILAGAGGGGGVASNGGAIMQPMVGLTYQINKNLGLQVMGGKIKAAKGNLDTTIVDIGVFYNFSMLGK